MSVNLNFQCSKNVNNFQKANSNSNTDNVAEIRTKNTLKIPTNYNRLTSILKRKFGIWTELNSTINSRLY